MRCRKNVKRLTDDQKKRFVNAVLALKSQDSVIHPGAQSRYDDFAETHMNAMMASPGWAHQDSVFFSWHRELLYQFEKLLQSVDPSVTIPYWDWTREQSSGNSGFPFLNNFIALDGTDADSDRVKRDPAAPAVDAMHPYIYPFDPETWSTTVIVTDGDGLDFFQRQFHERGDAPNLPGNDVTVTGTGTNFRAAINSGNNYLTLRARSEDLHNLVHRWVGGNMLRMTSPNDPVFFLHHAQIDRMWSLWQKKVPSGTPLYLESTTDAGHKLNDAMIFNDANPAPFPTGATNAQMINGHSMHGDGVWYDSDIPEIDAPASALDFINIPEGLTSYKAVKFKIKGCRKVNFRITGDPTGQFGVTPMGHEFEANPIEADDFYYGYVWVQFVAVAGPISNSSVHIHAYIIDDEGYYASSEGGEFALGDFTITLTATTTNRENNSIALVLDRSGSMSSPAGGTSTRSQLLGNAIEVFRTLMLPNDEVAVITFDDVVDTPISMQTVSGAPSFSTVDISPRNSTWIGGGIQQGAVQLAAATHSNKSMIVLTDGNENVHPYIGELPAGAITNRTYAIGFGLPGEVSDAALNQITSNTNGDLLITGNLSSDEQRFNLTKYFVQVLAGVTNSQIILDPNGKLYYGSKDTIPFKITEADVYVDAITLCPLPKYLDFILQTPSGTFIKPASVEPNVKYIMGQQVLCYRLVLPALAGDSEGSHAGTWNAILSLKSNNEVARLAKNKEFATNIVSPKVDAFLPYSFLVHATSNLQFNAWKLQESFKPGTAVTLFASLNEYDVPVTREISIWAEITRPDQSTFILKLQQVYKGMFTATFNTLMGGNYVCRVRCEGYSGKGTSFTREKTLTAGVYYGNYEPVPQPNPSELICRLLHCIFEEHEVFSVSAIKRFAELGFNLKRFISCIDEVCPELSAESIPGIKYRLTQAVLENPQLVSQVKLCNAVAAKPFKTPRKPKQHIMPPGKKDVPTMFMPLDLKIEEKRQSAEAKQHIMPPGKKKEVPTMFMPLDLKKEEKKKPKK